MNPELALPNSQKIPDFPFADLNMSQILKKIDL